MSKMARLNTTFERPKCLQGESRLPQVAETPRGGSPSRVRAAEAALYNDEPPEDRSAFEPARKLLQTALPRGAVILAVLTFGGYAAALLQKRVLTHSFGAGPEVDAFLAAFKLPELALQVLVMGGVVGPFLPLFVGLNREAREKARDFARTILTLSVLAMAVASAVLFIFAPQTLGIVAPGFTGGQRDLYVGLFRILCAAQILAAASLVLGEVLVAERRFITYGLYDVLYHGGIVFGAVVLGSFAGIYGAAYGAVIGAAIALGVRLFGIYRTGFTPRPGLALRTKGLGEFVRLMIPKMFGQPLAYLMGIYFTSLASTLASGSVTNLDIAQSFQSLPETLIGVAFATAAFPSLSAAASAGDKRAFKRTFFTNLATIGVLSTCAAVGLLTLGGLAIQILFGGGAFDSTDVAQTTMLLAILAFSIPLESITELLARAIYATHNTGWPMVAAMAGFAAGVISASALSSPLGLAAIPIGYTVCMATKVGLLAVVVPARVARIGGVSRWSRAIVHHRPGVVPGVDRRLRPLGQVVMVALVMVLLVTGTLFAAVQAVSHSTLAVDPQTTPWARTGGTRPPLVVVDPSLPTVAPTAAASASEGASPTVGPTATPATPGLFAMDLYQSGDFVSEIKDNWCVPAAMQTSMNIMSVLPDTTRDTQSKLFDLAVSIAGSSSGGADPVGWAKGLTSLGYGNYQVGARLKMADAIHTVAKQIRVTQRPAGLLVWYGWHSWVVSGFTATADPALTDNFTVRSVRIEDVWYPRISTIWGASRPPDADVPVGQLPKDYKTWVQAKFILGRDGYFVYVIPVN